MVIAIIGVLVGLSIPAFIAINRGRKVSDTSRGLQATLLRARSLARTSGQPTGVRFLYDPGQPEFMVGYTLVTQPPQVENGTVHVIRPVAPPPVPDETVPAEMTAQEDAAQDFNQPGDLLTQQDAHLHPWDACLLVAGETLNPADLTMPEAGTFPEDIYNRNGEAGKPDGFIRIEDSGPFYEFLWIDENRLRILDRFSGATAPATAEHHPAYAGAGAPAARLAELVDLPGLSFKVRLPQQTEPLEGEDPTILPSEVIIDLGNLTVATAPQAFQRLSRLRSEVVEESIGGVAQTVRRWEILFAPDGSLLPPQSSLGYASLWIRRLDEPMTNIAVGGLTRRALRRQGSPVEHSVVVVNPITGYVSSVRPNFTVGAATDTEFAPLAYYSRIERTGTRELNE